MLNYYLSLLVLVLFISANLTSEVKAQITIDKSDMPAPNDTIRVSRTTTFDAFPIDTTGENVMLDFTKINPERQEVIKYLDASKTPYTFFFRGKFGTQSPALNLLSSIPTQLINIQITDVFDFFENTDANFVAVGRGITFNGFPAPTFYTDHDEVYQFPLTIGKQDTSTFRYLVQVPTLIKYVSQGVRYTQVDGWGVIKLPVGDFECIRVVSTIQFKDSIEIDPKALPFPIPIPPFAVNYQRKEIKWFAKGMKTPVLQIDSLFGIPGSNAANQITFQDLNRLPTAKFTAVQTPEPCNPFVITLTNASMDAETYQWDMGDGNIVDGALDTYTYALQGEYVITLTAINALGEVKTTQNIQITGQILTAAFLPSATNFELPDATVTFTNATEEPLAGDYKYDWQFDDGTASTERSPVHQYQSAGIFNVTMNVEDPDGCTAFTTTEITVTEKTARDNPSLAVGLKVYPNPSREFVTIKVETAGAVEILDNLGRCVAPAYPCRPGSNAILSTGGLSSGVYIVRFFNSTGLSSFKGLMIE